MDPYKFLHISPNPDGSLTRSSPIPTTPPSQDPASPFPSLSKDIPLNPSHDTFIRLFLPKSVASSSASEKLPAILYFHGGGFVLFSAATSLFHLSCSNLAAKLPALILSLDYRLAPEHPLPAAYDDALDALLWLRNQARNPQSADPWIRDHADFSRCFLMGSSSGGNIAFHLGRRLVKHPDQLDAKPLVVDGLILNEPFFGGVERTESELRMENDKIVPLKAADLLWELALPRGADRDHEYCNPMAGKNGVDCKGMARCLVRGYVGDPLVDRQRAAVEMLERDGVKVVAKLEEEGFHAVALFDEGKKEQMVEDVRKFVYGDGEGLRAAGSASL